MVQRRFVWISLVGILACCCTATSGAEFYLAPGGSNANAGTLGSPWGTLQFAVDRLNPGDTLFVRGGTYNQTSRVLFGSGDGGTMNNRVNVWAYEENGVMETPIFDFSGMSNSLWGDTNGRGIQIDNNVDWVHLKGLTVQNARDNGLHSQSDNSIFERMVTRWNGDSGLQIDGSSSFNLVLNSDSYENYDPSGNGENADGFAIKFASLGPGNVVRGSRAWGNSDDGWDMWESTIGGVLVEDSWAYDNGFILPRFFQVELLEQNNMNAGNYGGDGNGFKLGQDGGQHVLNRVLAWENAVRGIDSNSNFNGITVSNSTVYNSVRNWDFDEDAEDVANVHTLRNNISFAGTQSDRFFDSVVGSNNTWDSAVTVTAADFLSLDDTIARGPRNADGSLPISDFLRLAPGSDLIDAGIDVGMPYNGMAPDMGAFETLSIVYAAADFDEDTDVDADDLATWETFYSLASGATKSQGDADGDEDVDGNDFLVWQQQYTGTIVPIAAVPEPAALALVACAALGWGRRFS